MLHERPEPVHRHRTLLPVAIAVVLWCAAAALTPWLGVWGGVGGAALLLGTGFLALYGKSLRPLLTGGRPAIIQGLAAGAVLVALTYLFFPLAVWLFPGLGSATAHLYQLFNSGPPLLRMTLPLVILGEEVVWRGVVQTAIQNRCRVALGAAVTAVIYAAAHAPMGEPLLVLVAFGCGLYWSLLRWRSESLVPALLSHLIWDLTVMVLFPLGR